MRTNTRKFLLVLFILLLAQLACNLPVRQIGPISIPGRAPTLPDLDSRLQMENYSAWVRKLSGAEPVQVGGQPALITTRYSYAMFTGQENARAFDFVLEQVRQWIPEDQIEVDEYPYTDAEHTYTWKNLIVTLPGKSLPDEVVVLSAHLDSIVVREGNALEAAPGADDNAVGSAALLEAARLLPQYRFERTIRLIWFTGEESSSAGSRAYIQDHPINNIVALINLDMFGYDSTGDRCFELHVGTNPASDAIGQAFVQTIQQDGLNLHFDYLTGQATDRSDHAPFWEVNTPAILVMENFFDDGIPGGCAGVDGTPFYHRPGDTSETINLPFAFDITRAALATVARLAGPLD
ncbi:MAG: Zn-dependent exopeptidase M28 [Anaerolineaceae bacterium]|nr:Zn-dependent exopeptidase M28 [Anaerolineaceae bacterium]